jgi:hypothetical protein
VLQEVVRFVAGLAVGAAIGAAAAWLAMARPWRAAPAPAVAAALDAGADEGKAPARRGKRGKRGRGAVDGNDEPTAPVLTAGDRGFAWRGPAIAAPDRAIDLGTDDAARPLTGGEIDDAVQQGGGAIVACIDDAVAGASLSGEVRLQLLVSGQGAVEKVRVGAPRWLLEHGVVGCAAAAARRLRFPATGAPTVVDLPFHLD